MHDQGVDYRGYVEDLRQVYHESRVYIAPVTSGGGIRTKIVEAMAAGIPVVSNSFAPLGLGVQPNREVIVRDDPQESAAAILRLLREDAHWRRTRDAARAFVQERFGLEQNGPLIAGRYLEFLREAA
jgi:glycosyltransferase involved in cell wall biosynthesis